MTAAFGLAALWVWAAASLAYRALALAAVGRSSRRAAVGHGEPESLDLMFARPLCGQTAVVGAAFESLCRAARECGAPVRVGVEDARDPVAKEALRIAEGHPDVVVSTRIGPGPAGANRKVANLEQACAGERPEFWLLTDADVRVPPEYAAAMTAPFAAPDVGLTTCAYRSVPADSRTSRLDALVTNLHFLPGTCLAVRVEGVHFALGASIALRSQALEAAGGFAALRDEPADDYVLARRVEAAGYRLAWAPTWVEHLLEDSGPVAAWRRHVRWARVTRSVRPWSFLALTLVTHGWAALVALIAAGHPGLGLAALVGWWSLVGGCAWRQRRALGVRGRDLAWLPIADALGLGVMLAAWTGRPSPP
ncbi:MAG: glycosyltransferase [Proteobacteria bacterium]|nr:glycosyltransferase [Pseudomonadota bacterium]